MDAVEQIPVNIEQWANVLTDAFAALQASKLRIEALEKENADLKKQLAGNTTSVEEVNSGIFVGKSLIIIALQVAGGERICLINMNLGECEHRKNAHT